MLITGASSRTSCPAACPRKARPPQTDTWSAAIAYAALLHYIGKIAVGREVEQLDGRRWHPWHGPLQQPYRVRYRPGIGCLDWLSGFPQLWGCLLHALAGQYERELVSQADRVCTARNIGATPEKALQAPTTPCSSTCCAG